MFEWSSSRIVNINIYFRPLSLVLHWQTSTQKWNRKMLWCSFDLSLRTAWMFLKTIHLFPTIFLVFSFIVGLFPCYCPQTKFFGKVIFSQPWVSHSVHICMMSLPVWLHGPLEGDSLCLVPCSFCGVSFHRGVSVQGVSVHGGLCRRRSVHGVSVCRFSVRWWAGGTHPTGILSYELAFIQCKHQRIINLVSCPNKTNSR